MAQIDIYRNTLVRKRDELAKLARNLAREQAKLSPLQRKINSANETIRRSRSESSVKSKLAEIERANRDIADVNKRIADIQTKISRKDAEIMTAEKNLNKEEERIRKRNADEDKKRLRESTRQTQAMEQAIRKHEYTQNQMLAEIEQLKTIPEKITVLFLTANPTDTAPLRLDEEARSIHEKIRLSDYRNSVNFETRWATRSHDLLQAINETKPTIVHFSGHDTETGELILLNQDGSTRELSKETISFAMATASDTIRLVVFNTCFTESQAAHVVEHIDAAIGMSDSIYDAAACTFAAQLYSSIGFGRSLQNSFNQAIAELLLEGIPGENIPQLYVREDIDPNDIILVRPYM